MIQSFSAVVENQRKFFRTGATRSACFRMAQLRRLLDALTEHETPLLAALHADLRKSEQQAFAAEVGFVMGEIRHAMSHLDAWMRAERRSTPLFLWPAKAAIQSEPLGVALIIGPWNYPLQLLLGPLLGAIAAGNCAVLKPSEFAPHTANAIAELIEKTFDPEYVTVVQGERAVSESLLREKFDSLFFTGSTAVGRVVMEAAARHLTPVTLELGGRSPCIVCADAPLEIAARRIAWGKFMNAGQTCVAPDHVWVERPVAAPFVAALKKAIAEFYGPDPQQSADYGRIIHRRHFDRLSAFLADGSILAGGRTDAADLYIEPTLLGEIPPDSSVLGEEIFGPILPVLEFDDLDAVLNDLGRAPSPLALYLFTRDHAVQQRVLAETRSGGVCINDTISHILGKDLPFGGLGESGMGTYHGKASFDAFSHRRTILRRSLLSDPKFRYPPGKLSWSTFKRLLRWFGNG